MARFSLLKNDDIKKAVCAVLEACGEDVTYFGSFALHLHGMFDTFGDIDIHTSTSHEVIANRIDEELYKIGMKLSSDRIFVNLNSDTNHILYEIAVQSRDGKELITIDINTFDSDLYDCFKPEYVQTIVSPCERSGLKIKVYSADILVRRQAKMILSTSDTITVSRRCNGINIIAHILDTEPLNRFSMNTAALLKTVYTRELNIGDSPDPKHLPNPTLVFADPRQIIGKMLVATGDVFVNAMNAISQTLDAMNMRLDSVKVRVTAERAKQAVMKSDIIISQQLMNEGSGSTTTKAKKSKKKN